MAHPFVVAANPGYLRDLWNAGFRTFSDIIDERYDQIDCPHTRAERIIDTVSWISNNMGAANFWEASRDICKYNQQHLLELAPQLMAEFPAKFFNFIQWTI